MVHLEKVHVLRLTMARSLTRGPALRPMVRIPVKAHMLDHMTIFLRWRTSAEGTGVKSKRVRERMEAWRWSKRWQQLNGYSASINDDDYYS